MNDNGLERKMPVSVEAEQSVLGALLIDPSCMDEIVGDISVDDFSLESHRRIFSTMQEMYLQSNDIDAVTLVDNLITDGVYDSAGGKEYIRVLAETVPNVTNVKDYVNIVKSKSVLRKLIYAADEISSAAYTQGNDVESIIDMAERKIYSISESRENKGFTSIREALLGVYDRLRQLAENRKESMGMPTGFSSIDDILVGLGKTDLVLVGARPGMGKTSFAMNIAVNVSRFSNKTVCVFSLEMSAEQLATRLISSEALVDSSKMRSGNLSDEDWGKIAHASSSLSDCSILIDDTAGITISSMKSKLRRVHNLGMVVIDYLQLMQSDKRNENRVQEVADISRALKVMAKEFEVPVICCAQLSRNPEARNDKRPMLSDLRDSGAIEQDADIVMFLYREEYYKKDDEEKQNTAEVIIAKNRHGSTGNIKIGWLGQYTKFMTLIDR